MAWTTSSNIVQRGDHLLIQWAGRSDGTDLTDSIIVNLSDYTISSGTPTYSRISDLYVVVDGMFFTLEWDATTDDLIIGGPPGVYLLPFVRSGPDDTFAAGVGGAVQPLEDPQSTGGTGDIVLTTNGSASNDGIHISGTVVLL